MQVAHCGDKPDKLSLGPQTDGDGLHLVYGAYDLHEKRTIDDQ